MKHFIVLFLLIAGFLSAQQYSSDDLFQMARNAAFNDKDYNKAISLSQQALEITPDYTDISIFLARLYTWDDQPEKAREIFKELKEKGTENADFFLAYGSLEYWNDNNEKALEIVNEGVSKNPLSSDLLILRAKINNSDQNYASALADLENALKIDPQNTDARSLLTRVQSNGVKNSIGVSYTHSHFDKQFEDDWRISTLSYKRGTKLGSVILKLNHASKFGDSGFQGELEAYPRISETFYMYVGTGYSADVGIFPKFRLGASLYANLPKSFEAEVGVRHLYFSDGLWMYTASVGKYYKNFWFNFRTYLTPSSQNVSHSYTATTRYYFSDANNYLGIQVGTGISPEEQLNSLLPDGVYKLKTFKVGADYNFTLSKNNLFTISGTYYRQEYRPETIGNQYDFSLGYARNF